MSAKIKNENTKQDDLISQLVETSYAFNFELKRIDLKTSPIEIVVVSEEVEISRETLTRYLTIVANFLNKDYTVLVYQNKKVEYQANYTDKKLYVFKFKI